MHLIVLCGGLGTRLGQLTRNMPKPMLTVAGRPFLVHVLDQIKTARITGIVMAAGFEWEKIKSYFDETWDGLPVQYSLESHPLGTGGAIKNALAKIGDEDALVVNGDTLFAIDISKFLHFANSSGAMACIALRKVEDCSRFGRVTIDTSGKMLTFGEKGHSGPGLINGGIYFLRRGALDNIGLTTFSFETEFLEARQQSCSIYAMPFGDYFIDIGIPADLHRAQTELATWKSR
jgi:D-glycero-alpha-D-manno-heptose 1-phosphate guanylyltransferase